MKVSNMSQEVRAHLEGERTPFSDRIIMKMYAQNHPWAEEFDKAVACFVPSKECLNDDTPQVHPFTASVGNKTVLAVVMSDGTFHFENIVWNEKCLISDDDD